jgi:hypothetical protein
MEIDMKIIRGLSLVPFLLMTVPVQAQSPAQGDYYAPGPTMPIQATPDQLKRSEQGDYYVGNMTILSARRMAAIKKCTDGIPFDSDRYVACMSQEGEAP